MRNIRLTIQYEGTNYSGWQAQPNETTIQGLLQEAIKKITGEDPKIIAAGRTDAGVHAIGQVAAFMTNSQLAADVIKTALNANLPEDIRITNASDTHTDFHPRYDAKSKVYFYIISNSHMVSPFLSRYVWRIPHKLDSKAMHQAIGLLEGRQDFSSFRASGCSAKTSTRTVLDTKVEKLEALDFMTVPLEGDFLRITIEADAFLRHMVRNIVGTVVEVGRSKFKAEHLRAIILSKDRKNAGPTAPAKGLFLERVNYR